MTEEKLTELLRQAGLKRTSIRVAVLKHLAAINHAVSQSALETVFENRENRVTIYRVLRDLEEKGLIHRIFDAAGTAKFALCNHSACSSHAHHDEHLHFNCTVCNHIFCMDSIEIPHLKMPEGFEIASLNISATGICKNCKQ
jgi:Fur family ferric uptake transcriptional regulator